MAKENSEKSIQLDNVGGNERITVCGYCPICERRTIFVASNPWYRDSLICQSCENGSVVRERALACVLKRERPNWRELTIHESSPAPRGISLQLKQECPKYTGSAYFPDKPLGSMVGEWKNEDFTKQTFSDETFDIVVSLDVTEHVFDLEGLFREIHRTLKKGGLYISTFPIRKSQVEDCIQRAAIDSGGGEIHLLVEPAEYHGNPFSESGSLVTYSFGYDIHAKISEIAPFSVEITRFSDWEQGIAGEYTEVVLCRKIR